MMFLRFTIALVCCAIVTSFQAKLQMKFEMPTFKKVVTAAIAGVLATSGFNLPSEAITKDQINSLNYLQVKGTGLANRCPEVKSSGAKTIELSSGKKYKITDFCIEPTVFQVEDVVGIKKGEEVKEFVNTKLMTRQTYTLDGISGTVEVKDGKAVFTEEDGIDYAATTVQLPGGARVPFLFSVKNLVAKGTGATLKDGLELGGSFTVPSYRSGLFLDPKGRGMTVGYDFAHALAGRQTGTEEDELFNENNKEFDVFKGEIQLAVKDVNPDDGEFAGVYVSTQPSDTDLGGKEPKQILTKGIFYGHIEAL
uniref:Uncharacterized protein n=1 Tax=Chromulina nebulosa TaxID=96789 RepID=A0A7S0SQQ0_9STRA|mmetsp:Transcript_1053/g.925  ORF Transcript_1053/g.925 Transcript_1053/m.925 type:complete len:309 (+) Transcript_1053:58-984(+)